MRVLLAMNTLSMRAKDSSFGFIVLKIIGFIVR